MSVTIQLKRGSGAPPTLADGEPGWDHTGHVLYVGTVGGTNYAVGGTPFTAEDAQDAVGAILTDTATVDFTYDDAANTIKADVVAGSIGPTQLASTAVTPGSYTLASLTVDAQGRLTAASSGSVSGYQPLDATLTALAALSTSANQLIVSTLADSFVMLSLGANTFPARSSTGDVAAKPVTDFALTVLDDTTAAAVRATLGVAVGSDVQAHDATLDALAALTIAANSLTVGTGADAFSQTTFAANTFPARASTGSLVAKTITDFGLSLVDDADAATARATLGGTTAGGNLFTLTNPSAVTFIRVNADNTVSALDAATFRTAIGAGTGAGTVTSVSGTANQVSVATGTTTPVVSLAGPHNYTTQTSHGVLLGQGTSAVTAAAAMTDGQLLVGQTGADPLPKALSGDATLAASGALTLANSGASAGTYTNATVTVDAKGRVTAASSGSGGAGANLYLHHALG